jgi:hypothetical protein
MSLRLLPVSVAGFGLALLAFAPSANAHIRLVSPAPRYEITGNDTGIKSCPCGLGSSNRTCNLATDASDPDGRSERVMRVEAGSQLMLSFVEYIDHSGSFRVAFDPDGADVADFNANILVPFVMDPSNANNMMWQIPVTVPNTTCDNCTIQLIQAMNGDMTNPVADPTSISTYYACVDLEIVAPGTLGNPPDDGETDPTDEPAPMPMPAGMGGSNGMTAGSGMTAGNGMTAGMLGTVPMMGDTMGGGSTTPAGMSTGNPSTAVGGLMPGAAPAAAPNLMNESESSESGGCALGVSALRASGSSAWAMFGLAGVLTLLVRRRRNRA